MSLGVSHRNRKGILYHLGHFTQSTADRAANSPHLNCVLQNLESKSRYSPVMRFVLVDRDLREFEAQRMCYRSSIDGWLALDSGCLRDMAKKYIFHLGDESFFELFAWSRPPRSMRTAKP